MAESTPLGGTTVVDDSFDRWMKADEAKNVEPLLNPPPVLPPVDNPPVQRVEVEHTPEPVKEPDPIPPVEEPPTGDRPEAARPPAPEAEEPEELEGRDEGERRGRKRPSWKEVRELEKQLKEEREARLRGEISRDELMSRTQNLEQQMQSLRRDEPERTEEVTEPEDPLDKATREIERLKVENQQRDVYMQRQSLDQQLAREEQEFSKTTPDFNDRLKFFVESEKREWKAVGAVDSLAAEILRRDPKAVKENALRVGKSEQETAEEMALGAILAARRDTVITSARMAGKRVPQVISELAENRGYRREAKAEAPAPVRRDEQAVREATRSIATATRSAPPPPKAQITSRRELRALDARELERYIMEHDSTDPGWLSNLTD